MVPLFIVNLNTYQHKFLQKVRVSLLGLGLTCILQHCFMSVGVKLAWPSLLLCGYSLPWVSTTTHRDHGIHESGEMSHDTTAKRAILIGKSCEVCDSFAFAAPSSMLRALQVYCSSYYGSLAGWDLEEAEAQKFHGVWTLIVLLSYHLPCETYRYFLPMLAQGHPDFSGL